jgi:hypothetical protein
MYGNACTVLGCVGSHRCQGFQWDYKMISIDGLTQEQCDLLDTMWNIKGVHEYEDWKNGLSERMMDLVDTLEQMVILAELDDITDEECGKAKKVLDKIMSLG